MLPYKEKVISENKVVREFSGDADSSHLVWHRDREHRKIKVLFSEGWMLQKDNCLPEALVEGNIYEVKYGEWHRVIKGKGSLVIAIEKS